MVKFSILGFEKFQRQKGKEKKANSGGYECPHSSRISGLYDSLIFNFLRRNLLTIFHSLHSHQQYIEFPFVHILNNNTCYLNLFVRIIIEL